tara:strand:+ start:135 stop:587 length:453 start_codon:yes stop_codon:yes gene_type:complete
MTKGKPALRSKCKRCNIENDRVRRLSQPSKSEARTQYRLDYPKETWAVETEYSIRKRALNKGLNFDLNREWLLAQIPERCPLLNIPIVFSSGVVVDGTPTVDRKNPKLGYLTSNCWVISAKANRMKSNASTREIELLAYNLPKMYAAHKK